MHIFITGIAGFLGSHLADALISDGHTVFGCDNLIGGYIDNVPPQAVFHQVDCHNIQSMNDLLSGIDVVYHCACTAYEGLSLFSPHQVVENTFGISASVFSAAINRRVKRIVYCSSMARYGTQDELPFVETMKAKPQDPYGIAKVASEELLRTLASVHGIEYVICVPHNIIGTRQKYDDPYRNVASIMINLVLQGRQPIIYGDGKQKRCFSDIRDVIEPLVKMLDDKEVVGEVINVGPDEEFIEINTLAMKISDMIGCKHHPIYVPCRPQEVKNASCSAQKARKLLNYSTKYTLDDSLQAMINWIKERGPKQFEYHLDLEIPNDMCPSTWKNKVF